MAYMLRALVRQSLALKLNNSGWADISVFHYPSNFSDCRCSLIAGVYMSISRPVFTHTSFYPHDYVRRRKEKEQEFFKIKGKLDEPISNFNLVNSPAFKIN